MTPEQNALLTTIDMALDTIRTTVAAAEAAAAALRDTVGPPPLVLTGTIEVTDITQTGYVLVLPETVTGGVAPVTFELSMDGGSSWEPSGGSVVVVTGRLPGSTDQVRYRAVDATWWRSSALVASIQLLAAAPSSSVAVLLLNTNSVLPPLTAPNVPLILDLHASSLGVPGGAYITRAYGNVYRASYTPGSDLASVYQEDADTVFSVYGHYNTANGAQWGLGVSPRDSVTRTNVYGVVSETEFLHDGYSAPIVNINSPQNLALPHNAIRERRYLAILQKVLQMFPNVDPNKIVAYGNSMGAWAALRLALHYPEWFAVSFSSRPRWRSNATVPGMLALPAWDSNGFQEPLSTSRPMSAADGGGLARDRYDLINHVLTTTKWIRPILWTIANGDSFTPFSDHVEAVAALRARRVPFQVAWKVGDHGNFPIDSVIGADQLASYSRTRGCPLFEGCSGDQVIGVDPSGGINLGLRFRNVNESAGAWSCEVTNILGARTVHVSPYSQIFTTSVTPKLVSIPAANTWVPVSFTE